jgi:hypothetical protein
LCSDESQAGKLLVTAPEARPHPTTLETNLRGPVDVPAGTDLALSVKVSCARGCDLTGHFIRILDRDDEVVGEACLTSREGTAGMTEEVRLRVPNEPGVCSWRVVFPVQRTGQRIHDESLTPLTLVVVPHQMSVAVWDMPSPVVAGRPFSIKTGVRCSSGCPLTNLVIVVANEEGIEAASARLGDSPWPGTAALHWTSVALQGPARTGEHTWHIRALGAGDRLHDTISSIFRFSVAPPPDHQVSVRTIDGQTRAGIGEVEIRLGAYRGCTDESGRTSIAVPKGRHDVRLWKLGYDAPAATLDVTTDLTVDIELTPVPSQEEPYWM